MANKCKCGNTESYNFALNIGLCNPCIGERLEELEAQLKSARAKYDIYKECAEDKVKSQADRIKKLEAHLMNINNCVAIIANDEVVRTSKELPKILTNLEKYIEDALKGK